MSRAQPGIFALGSRYHHHVEFDLHDTATTDDVVVALGQLLEVHVTAGATNMVLGVGSALWQRICGDDVPAGLGPFTQVAGLDGHIAPVTQHDLWVWVHGSGADSVVDTAAIVASNLSEVATVAADRPCFVYHDSRDLTGFIDGTANPTPVEAPEVAVIPDGQPGAGGSHVLAQRFVHDLDAFAALDVADQERVFGRTKSDSVALPKPRPADAHITLAEVHDDEGEEREIYRRSVPYGDLTERGLYFLAFSAERDRFDAMLTQLYGAGGRDIRDRLLDFTTAVSGAYYFAPSLEALRRLGVGTD